MIEYIDKQELMYRLKDFCDWCKDDRKSGAYFVYDCIVPNMDTIKVNSIK